MILQDDIVQFARKALDLQEHAPVEVSPLQERGSDRAYFRVTGTGSHSAILPIIVVRYSPKRMENTYFVAIAGFLGDIHVPVPKIIRHDPKRSLIAMQDLGDTDLCSLRKASWDIRRAIYEKTLTVAHRLHSFPLKNFPSDRVKLMPGFDSALYHWERDYFRSYFVKGACEIKLHRSFDTQLEAELFSLAERLRETRLSLIHRDLQSQNIMVVAGEPCLIDFQGMCFGSPFYDLGSLLCDPYTEFSGAERDGLLSFYYGLVKEPFDWAGFQKAFWEASVQRLMQALGAYGFLGLTKGLPAFLSHIPAGLRHLQFAAAQVKSLPRLLELCEQCQRRINLIVAENRNG